MQLTKKLFSGFNEVATGTVNLMTGDFIPDFPKSQQSRNPARSQLSAFRGTKCYQDGYDPARFQPTNRGSGQLNQAALKKVSRTVASEGVKDKGVISW